MNPKPIFIVGAPRSGTTLLRSLIDKHSKICLPPWETGLFDRLSDFTTGDFERPSGVEANFCPLKRERIIDWIRQSADALMAELTRSTNKKRWGEKTPSHVFHIDLIREVYPESQFIHIIRNGRDVVKSLLNVEWGPREIKWSVGRWRDSILAGQAAADKYGPKIITEVRYDQLTANTKQTLHNICNFLGEDFEPSMLDEKNDQETCWGASPNPIRDKAIYSKSYRNLTWRERVIMNQKVGPLLRSLGY